MPSLTRHPFRRHLAASLTGRAGRVLEFVWSGWAGLAALCLLAAVWQAGHEAYGPFILTAPLDTVQAVGALAADPEARAIGAVTLQRAVTGFALVAAAGTALGVAAGYAPAILRLAGPLVTVLMGVPPIAWIVLAMIWFGGTDATVRTVILVSALPVVFLGAGAGHHGQACKARDADRHIGGPGRAAFAPMRRRPRQSASSASRISRRRAASVIGLRVLNVPGTAAVGLAR